MNASLGASVGVEGAVVGGVDVWVADLGVDRFLDGGCNAVVSAITRLVSECAMVAVSLFMVEAEEGDILFFRFFLFSSEQCVEY